MSRGKTELKKGGGGCKGNVRGHNGGARTVKEANLPFNVSGSHGKVKAEQDSG